MKQTAVEWFIKKIAEDYPEIPKAYREECNKAKEMEKDTTTKPTENELPRSNRKITNSQMES